MTNQHVGHTAVCVTLPECFMLNQFIYLGVNLAVQISPKKLQHDTEIDGIYFPYFNI